jgi:hypothetical protein
MHVAPQALAQESPEMLVTLLAVLNEQNERWRDR